jgi:ATP-dependent Clp protease ATP-binding subunit ClpC
VNFRNTIIIMTSNAGTRDVKKQGTVGFGKTTGQSDYESMKGKVLDELKRIFNPEFLNRVDETVVFFALTKKEIAQILEIQLRDVQSRLTDRQITLHITQAVKDYIVDQGFDPILGARPLRRAIQRLLEDRLAEEFLSDKFHDRDAINVELENNAIVFVKANQKDEAV